MKKLFINTAAQANNFRKTTFYLYYLVISSRISCYNSTIKRYDIKKRNKELNKNFISP